MKGDLAKAQRLFQNGKYPQVIRLLESQIFKYRESNAFFYLMGFSCLHTGDLGGADTYLQRSLSLKPDEVDVLLGLSVVQLKRRSVEQALRYLLEILDEEPSNRKASLGLKILKRHATPDQAEGLANSPKIMKLLPGKKQLPVLPLTIFIFVIAVGTLSYFIVPPIVTKTRSPRQSEVAALSIRNIPALVEESSDARHQYSESEIEQIFKRAKRHFADYRDNLSQVEINRLLVSNASLAVKEQARTIAHYIQEPDFTTIRDSFSYLEVVAELPLYSDCFVTWRGKVANIELGTENIIFDLLVGYEEGKIIIGVVSVSINFAALINQGDPVEVLGKIVILDNLQPSIEGISIRKLYPSDIAQ